MKVHWKNGHYTQFYVLLVDYLKDSLAEEMSDDDDDNDDDDFAWESKTKTPGKCQQRAKWTEWKNRTVYTALKNC